MRNVLKVVRKKDNIFKRVLVRLIVNFLIKNKESKEIMDK